MTLRYDRIDNFWYTLLHELAHISLHLDACGDDDVFVDDHSLRGMEAGAGGSGDTKEEDADRLAEEALIPREVWDASPVPQNPSPNGVINLAQSLGIHPAIVAGRIRHERGNYRLLSQFVGTGEVRRQFEGQVLLEGWGKLHRDEALVNSSVAERPTCNDRWAIPDIARYSTRWRLIQQTFVRVGEEAGIW